jgi:hypothetical protein
MEMGDGVYSKGQFGTVSQYESQPARGHVHSHVLTNGMRAYMNEEQAAFPIIEEANDECVSKMYKTQIQYLDFGLPCIFLTVTPETI